MGVSGPGYLRRENKGLKANWYRAKTSLTGIKRLATLPPEDKQACVDAYKFFQRMQDGEDTKTEDETKAVAAYYKVLNNMLSVFDLEKLYIPPQLDEDQGLYGNQLLCEQDLLRELNLSNPKDSHSGAVWPMPPGTRSRYFVRSPCAAGRSDHPPACRPKFRLVSPQLTSCRNRNSCNAR